MQSWVVVIETYKTPTELGRCIYGRLDSRQRRLGRHSRAGRLGGHWVGIVGLTRSSNADCMGWHNRYIVITDKVGIGDYNIG